MEIPIKLSHCGVCRYRAFRGRPAYLIREVKAAPHNFTKKVGDRHMENKPAQNIQDTFLNTVRKDKSPITIYLVSGVKLTGKIRSFDKYSVLLENNSQEQLIFKHAISTVVSNRSVLHTPDYRPAGQGAGAPITPATSPAAPAVANPPASHS